MAGISDMSDRVERSTSELAAEYSNKASAYAQYWAPVLRGFSIWLLDRLPLRSAARVIEVGCGTGLLLSDLRARATHSDCILGVDRAGGMLRVGQSHGSSSLAAMDARRLAVIDSVFDVAVCAFMLFHVAEPANAVRELRRILRTGGCVGVAVWGSDPGVPGKSVWLEELSLAGAAPDPRPPEVMHQGAMDTEAKLAGLLCDGGFHTLRTWSVRHEYQWQAEDLLAMQLGYGMVSRRLASLSEANRQECVVRASARVATFTQQDLVYRPEVIYAVASS